MMILFANWAAQERDLLDTRLREAIPKLEAILQDLHFAAGAGNAAKMREHLADFEEVETSVSDDLELLERLYELLPDGWQETSDAELVEAARKAFGGTA